MTYRWASLHVLKFLVNILAGEGLGVFLHLVARETKEEERETASHQERRSRPPAFFPYGPVSLCLLLQ